MSHENRVTLTVGLPVAILMEPDTKQFRLAICSCDIEEALSDSISDETDPVAATHLLHAWISYGDRPPKQAVDLEVY